MFEHPDQVLSVAQAYFGKPRVLVIGDVMLDRYLWGDVNRISPESPVPVVRVTRETEVMGGAANVASNLASLGARVSLAGYIGQDESGTRLRNKALEAEIETVGLISIPGRPTTIKTRVIGGHQQMLRIDIEVNTTAPDAESDLLSAISTIINASGSDEGDIPAAIVLSDYAKGVLSEPVCHTVIAIARSRDIPVFAAPKGTDYRKYTSATALVLNKSELASATHTTTHHIDAMTNGARLLQRVLSLEYVLLTRGEQGISLIEPDSEQHAPAMARQVFDVSGAGDTVIGTFAMGVLAGLTRIDSVRLANVAAGIVVGKVGTVAVSRTELLTELTRQRDLEQIDKICNWDKLGRRLAEWRNHGERIVFTNGCFDLLHAGHVVYLEKARREGNRLIVGLNTDASVRRIKGDGRPIIHEGDRARVLAALASVDAVVLFDDDTPINLIRAVKPDVLVKGGDYTEDGVIGASDVRQWGGIVALIPYIEGRSTTRIIKRIEATD